MELPKEYIAKLTNTVNINNYTRGLKVSSPNSVRCYINSPKTIMLQLRGATRYASVSLTPAEAALLAGELYKFSNKA